MNKGIRVAGPVCCLFAVLVLNGGHWAALQTLAWGRMFINFAQQDSVAAALVKTFDGEHPCALCLTVRNGLQETQQEERVPWTSPERLPEPLWEFRRAILPAPQLFVMHEQPIVPQFTSDFVDSPPTPPPRDCSHIAA
jgi:hypothetical protein